MASLRGEGGAGPPVPNEPVARGALGTVEWAEDAAGNVPARDFFSNLDDPDAAKVLVLFRRLAETGQIRNVEQFKKLGTVRGRALWEFKRFQLRFLGGFAGGRRFLVAHGLRKKKDRHSPRDLERAARILMEHLDREERCLRGRDMSR